MAVTATKRPVPKRLIISPKPSALLSTARPMWNLRKQRWGWTAACAPGADTPPLDLAEAFDALTLDRPSSRTQLSRRNCHEILPELDNDFIAGLESVFGSPSVQKGSASGGNGAVRPKTLVTTSAEELESQFNSMSLRS